MIVVVTPTTDFSTRLISFFISLESSEYPPCTCKSDSLFEQLVAARFAASKKIESFRKRMIVTIWFQAEVAFKNSIFGRSIVHIEP